MQAICLRIWKKRHKRKKERRKKTQQCYGVLAKSVEPYLIFGYYYVINSQYGSKCLTTFFRCVHRKKNRVLALNGVLVLLSFFLNLSRYALDSRNEERMATLCSLAIVRNMYAIDEFMMLTEWTIFFWPWFSHEIYLEKKLIVVFFFVAVCHRSVHTLTSIASIHFFVSLNIWQPQFFFAILTACVVV